MQQSSTSVGALAAALAKAQAAIANPEKSLTATITSPFPREGSRTFRYAPLSSGLDLVRKCLGQHEIATIQTTTIDRDSGLIKLTTTLVHASGEWVSSDWPVSPITETAAPHRLGAALTYARRYALFTLVGIAGEDDLDAPDLPAPRAAPTQTEDQADLPETARQNDREARQRIRPKRPLLQVLSTEASSDLRGQLVAELGRLDSSEALVEWVHDALPLKNQLSATDALFLEEAFSTRLQQLERYKPSLESPDSGNGLEQSEHAGTGEQQVVVIQKPVRERDREHLRLVGSQPCLVCGRTPSDAHHVKLAEQRAMARKVSDKFTVPVCRLHHRELHRRGDERAWWAEREIDPLAVASRLWEQTRKVTLEANENANERLAKKNNGSRFVLDSELHRQLKNSETKPIHGLEVK